MAHLQVTIESAIFSEKARFFMTVNLAHPDAQDPLNREKKIHRTSLSSGQSTSAIFNIHSFNLGDISAVSPDTLLDFKSYKAVGKDNYELSGQFQLAIA